MQYSRHRPTASVASVTMLTYAYKLALWSVRQKLNRVRLSLQFSTVTSLRTRL